MRALGKFQWLGRLGRNKQNWFGVAGHCSGLAFETHSCKQYLQNYILSKKDQYYSINKNYYDND